MIDFRQARAWIIAPLVLALCPIPWASALDPSGVVPATCFSDGDIAISIETVNDSTATCANRVETDDIRSFGLRAFGSWRGLALGLACDGFTFRSGAPETATRSDELSLSAAWRGSPLGGGLFALRPGAGLGLRAWGDFGFKALQESWHDILGINRPFPTAFTEPSALPFAYVAADMTFRPPLPLPLAFESELRELVLGSGGIESSIALLAAWRDGGSSNRAGLSRQDRLGALGPNEELASEYERGSWLVASARTGFLSIESSVNLETNFALQTIALRFGAETRESGRSGPRQELAVGTSLLQSQLATARFLVIQAGVELHAGIEAVAGVSRTLWEVDYLGIPYKGYPHFQELYAVVELFPPKADGPLGLRPFAGAAMGARQDGLSVSDLQRSELVDRTAGFLCKAYAGLRLCEIAMSRGDRIAADFGAGLSLVAGRGYQPIEPSLFLRIAVVDR